MKQYPIKYKSVRDHRKEARCVNPVCGKWSVLYQEKYCPRCGSWTVVRPDKRRCDYCSMPFQGVGFRDIVPVCRYCGCKQRVIVELRGLRPEKLTDFAHLLHEGQPSVSLKECCRQCRSITAENPLRLSFARKPEQIRPYIEAWNALGGTAAACLVSETSRRPVVLLHSYNYRREFDHARLLFEAIRKSNRSNLSYGETAQLLHGINSAEKPVRLFFTSDYDHIDDWVAAWRRLGGTATRSPEHL